MDNLGSHRGKAVRQLIRSAWGQALLSADISPDLNPIEQVFAKLKHRCERPPREQSKPCARRSANSSVLYRRGVRQLLQELRLCPNLKSSRFSGRSRRRTVARRCWGCGRGRRGGAGFCSGLAAPACEESAVVVRGPAALAAPDGSGRPPPPARARHRSAAARPAEIVRPPARRGDRLALGQHAGRDRIGVGRRARRAAAAEQFFRRGPSPSAARPARRPDAAPARPASQGPAAPGSTGTGSATGMPRLAMVRWISRST